MNKETILILALLSVFTSCSIKSDQEVIDPKPIEVSEKTKKRDQVDVSPTSFISRLIIDNIDNKNFNINKYKDSSYIDIENGNFDIAIVPGYLGSYFYNCTNQNIEIAGITSIDNIKLVSDSIINDQNDLKDKNLYIADPVGNLSDVVDKKLGPLNLFLKLNIEYYKNMDDIVKKLDESHNFLAIMNDPYYQKLEDNNYYTSDLSNWIPIAQGEFVSEIIIVNKDYLKNNKESFNQFLKCYKEASNKLKKDPIVNDDILNMYNLTEKEAKKAINDQNLTFIDGDTMKGTYKVFLERLKSLDTSLLGDIIPDDDFYYTNK